MEITIRTAELLKKAQELTADKMDCVTITLLEEEGEPRMLFFEGFAEADIYGGLIDYETIEEVNNTERD